MSNTSNLREREIDEAVAEYLEAERLGRPIGALAWLARHAIVRDELEKFLADRSVFARAAGPVEPPTMGLDESTNGTALPTVRYFGDYELIEEIARGGMGVVYRARQVSLNRVVALKMILRGSLATPEDVQRFRTEAEAAANLDDPHIVPIFEVGEHEGHQYFTMKYIDGFSLSERMRGDKEHNARQLVGNVMLPVARAVHYAHQRGILHRDLKPGNILLDADGTPYVADFGLARRLDSDSSVTRTGQVVGSPSYMSPEQARGEKVLTTSADVYSLGAMLYESLTGQPPFRGASVAETLKQVLDNEPPHPRSVNSVADSDLSIIAMKCLEKDPSRRYDSAAAVADELKRWLAGEPIQARPVSRLDRGWRWAKRNPLAAGLATAFVLSLAGGTIGMAALYSQAVARRDEANNERSIAFARELSARRSWYSADISLAARAWDAGSTPRVRQLLEQHPPKPGERDLRGFEWNYLWRVMHAAKETKQLGNGKEGNWRLLANGRYATCSDNKSNHVEVWNLETSQRRELPGQFVLADWHGKDGDQRWIVATGEMALAEPNESAASEKAKERDGDFRIRTFDVGTGEEIGATRKIPLRDLKDLLGRSISQSARMIGQAYVGAFALAGDGRILVEATSSSNMPEKMPNQPLGVLKLMLSPSHEIRARFTDLSAGTSKEFSAAGFWVSGTDRSATFSRMAVRPNDGSLALIVTDMPKSLGESALCQYAGDLASGMKTSVFRFDPTKGFISASPFSKRIAAANGLTFSPEGKDLIIVESDHTLRIRDAETWQETGELRGHTGAIRCIAFSPDGAFLATAGEDLTIRVWDRKTCRTAGVFPGNLEQVSGLAFTADSGTLVSVDRRGTVKHWERANPPGPRVYSVPQISPTPRPGHIAFLDSGSKILVHRPDFRRDLEASRGNVVEKTKVILDLASGRHITERPLPTGAVAAIASRGADPWILLCDTATISKPARLWNTATNIVTDVPPMEGIYFTRRALSPDGRFVTAIAFDKEGQYGFVRTLEGTQSHDLFRGKTGVTSQFFDFSADGRQVLILSSDLGFCTWNAETGQAGLSVPLTVAPTGRAGLSGDGKSIYFATEDRQIGKCDIATGSVTLFATGSIERPMQVLVSPDDQRLFVLSGTLGSPWSIVVWDLTSGRELITLPIPAPSVKTIVLSPDGTKLAADTADAVIVWDATPLSR